MARPSKTRSRETPDAWPHRLGYVRRMLAEEPARATARRAGEGGAAVRRRRGAGVIAPGRTELEVQHDVRDLAAELLGVEKHWHKRIVRAGANTLDPYDENPPDRVIADDDIVFLDFGPVFEEWEADFGRTYVLGEDPVKHQLRDDLAACSPRRRGTSTRTPTSPASSCTRRRAAGGGARLGVRQRPLRPPGRRVPARHPGPRADHNLLTPAATSRCAGRTWRAGRRTGSSRCTSSTGPRLRRFLRGAAHALTW